MIIGVSGKIGSGKTTFSGHLAKMIGARVEHLSFPIKTDLSEQGIPMELMESQEGKKVVFNLNGVSDTVRNHMVNYGRRKREEDPDYFIKALLRRVIEGNYYLTVVDDVRMLNEVCEIARRGLTIRLEHYQEIKGGDETETGLDNWPLFDFTFRPAFGTLKPLAYIAARKLTPYISVAYQLGGIDRLCRSSEVLYEE